MDHEVVQDSLSSKSRDRSGSLRLCDATPGCTTVTLDVA